MQIAEPRMREQAGLDALVQRARDDDHDAFAEIYSSYYRRVLGLCRQRLGQEAAFGRLAFASQQAEKLRAEVLARMQEGQQ